MVKLSMSLILAVVLVTLIFTGLDYAGHLYLEKNASLEVVPSTYYTNKIIFGSALLLIGVFFIDWLSKKYPILERPYYRTSALTLFVILLLQLRYAYQGYSLHFHILVLGLHYLALGIPLYFAEKKG